MLRKVMRKEKRGGRKREVGRAGNTRKRKEGDNEKRKRRKGARKGGTKRQLFLQGTLCRTTSPNLLSSCANKGNSQKRSQKGKKEKEPEKEKRKRRKGAYTTKP